MVGLSSQTLYLGSSSEDICRLFKSGTVLRKPGTCNEKIVCQDSVSTDGGSCSGTTPYFSLSEGKCYKSSDSSSYCSTSNICKASIKGYVGDTRNCANWYYCDGKDLKGQGACDGGMVFDKEKGMCVYPEHTDCTATYEMCDIVPVKTYFRDEDNCNKYFVCTSKGALDPKTCDAGKYFDVATATCIDKKLVVCDKHPLPEDACGTKKLAYRNKFVSDNATCRGYYYCRDLGSGVPDPDPTYQQCSEDYFFSQERQACVPRENQKCDFDRCDGKKDGYVVAQDEGCQKYIECVDGREGVTIACNDTMYFNVGSQSCIATQTSYGACST
ncbi:peritrophin-48 isoform X2 [Drosophila ficusphila]|nr:peritrophin-48 isoform X2 [Drosophila ficusphila]